MYMYMYTQHTPAFIEKLRVRIHVMLAGYMYIQAEGMREESIVVHLHVY